MSHSVSTLLLAVVGVLGTLASALLTQCGAMKAKQTELDQAQRQHESDRVADEQRAAIQARRACYIEVNQTFRHYQAALDDYLSSLLSHPVTEGQRAEVEETRHASRDAYAEAQMILPEELLDRAAELVKRFNFVYGLLKRFDQNNQRPDDDLDTAREQLDHVTAGLYYLRQRMRAELGISDSGQIL
ncbi:hypothetical protein [Streptomyces sp. NPDC055692]|uniref:hypothetical protein n=1 Tax=Streptomyces sp. NPDC055692 TaxID=3155683 RepID=UPI0034309482